MPLWLREEPHWRIAEWMVLKMANAFSRAAASLGPVISLAVVERDVADAMVVNVARQATANRAVGIILTPVSKPGRPGCGREDRRKTFAFRFSNG
jgi:hypothetical protein